MIIARCYANLYWLVKDLTGLEIKVLSLVQSFGLFLALAFLTAAWFLSQELKRKESLGLLKAFPKRIKVGEGVTIEEWITSILFGAFIGLKVGGAILDFNSLSEDPSGYLLSLKGNWIGALIGAAGLAFAKYREKEPQKLPQPKEEVIYIRPHEALGDIVMVAAISGIIGTKLFYLFETPGNFQAFLEDPMGSLSAGLTIFGGWVCGTLATMWYVWKKGLAPLHVADAAAPTMFIAYAVGRIGCQVSGDGDWGIINTLPNPGFIPSFLWAQSYPHNVGNEGEFIRGCLEPYCHVLVPPVFPTPLYEIIMATALFLFMWSLRKKLKAPGAMFALFFVLYGIERFFIEFIRVNHRFDVFGIMLSQAQIISLVFIVIGLLAIAFTRRKFLTESLK